MARIRGTGVIQMAQQPGLSGGTSAVKASNPVDTSSPIEASRINAIIDVVTAIGSVPPVDANAVVSPVGVGTGGSVFADRRLLNALVHVRFTILTGKARRTLAVIRVDPIHAGGTVLTHIARAVVNILLAIFALETWRAFTFVVVLRRLLAGAPVLAGRRRARNVMRFAVLPGVSGFTHALVGSMGVDALATVHARTFDALLDVLCTGRTLKPLRADTLEVTTRG